MVTFVIREHHVPGVVKRIERARAALQRHGLTIPDPRWGQPFEMTLAEDGKRGWARELTLDDAVPRLGGWAIIGAIDHVEGGNVVKQSHGRDLSAYRTAAPRCEHCNTIRKRVRTYLLEDKHGRRIQVGANCLSDFTGREDVLSAIAAFDVYADLTRDLGGGGEEGGGSSGRDIFDTLHIAELAAAVVRTSGWVSRRQAEAETRVSTADVVMQVLGGKVTLRPSPEDADHAKEALDWAQHLPDTEVAASTSDYLHNIRVLARTDYIDWRHIAIVCSIVPAYDRWRAQHGVQHLDEWVGAPGDKVSWGVPPEVGKKGAPKPGTWTEVGLWLVIEDARSVLGMYGETTLMRFRDDKGRALVWFATGKQPAKVGDRVALVATIKKHETYQGKKQTILTRAVIREPRMSNPKGHLYEDFGHLGEPTRHERGFVEARLSRPELEYVVDEAVRLWRGDSGPHIAELLATDLDIDAGEPVPDDERLFQIDDLQEMLAPPGKTLTHDDVLTVFQAIRNPALHDSHLPERFLISLTAEAIDPARRDKPRLVAVSKALAADFVRVTHSELPELRNQGFLYAVGVAVGGRLVAVATVNTPSGAFRNPDRVVDLSRIASDGTVRGASSMLAARVIDLLPRAGRNGPGTLLVTYSLLSEAGTTYLALADKGLRPTRYSPPHRASGSRRGAGDSALRLEGKIVWEAGPDAAPPDWSLMSRTEATPAQIAGAKKSFDLWTARTAPRRPNPVYSFADAKDKRDAKRLARQGLAARHLAMELLDIFELFGFPDASLGELATHLFCDTVIDEVVRRALRRKRNPAVVIDFAEARLVVIRQRAERRAPRLRPLLERVLASLARHAPDLDEASRQQIAGDAVLHTLIGREAGHW